MLLNFADTVKQGQMRIRLWDATVEGSFSVGDANLNMMAFAQAQMDLIVIRLE